ncbi:hypothetical protein [Paenibacillus sp. MMS20-IR301]|uniref:hypothetical protein n=1 Tax=Paenibacillus sp. MMS20-IR301 TaxID=2895946 RepID=UPI0028E99615|nr:hypothetical protein [Paenibacillus sp. MMS20-IR301]WNS42069.1 hypothetical protein LOS79_24110 [Paenibacillus sp. MMS20-IR301]
MDARISLHNNDIVSIATTDDNNIMSIKLNVSNNDLVYFGSVDRKEIVNLLEGLHKLLYETNGELKKGDLITIGHKHASDNVLHDYSDKIGLRAIVEDPYALWSVDEEGNEVRFVWAALEGKKRNKYVDIHVEDALRLTI